LLLAINIKAFSAIQVMDLNKTTFILISHFLKINLQNNIMILSSIDKCDHVAKLSAVEVIAGVRYAPRFRVSVADL
jgi:hypothetical protein